MLRGEYRQNEGEQKQNKAKKEETEGQAYLKRWTQRNREREGKN